MAGDDDLVRVVRASGPVEPLTPEIWERAVTLALEGVLDPADRAERRAALESMQLPETLPTYDDLILARDGHIWAADYRLPWEDQPVWTVFSPEGVELGRVETPIGFTVHEIGADYILGLDRDELGVERIVLYDLIRPE
jgi:hypothetical protein